jgi:hypothetical protein
MAEHPPTSIEQVAALLKLAAVQPLLTPDGVNLTTATAVSPGSAPNWPPTLVQIGVDSLVIGVFPAIVANAASIAPGTDKATAYSIPSTLTIPHAAAITLATTGLTSRGCDVFLICKSLTLGFIMSIVNGGPAGGTIGTFAASMTKSEVMRLWWDGTNFIFNGQDWIA